MKTLEKLTGEFFQDQQLGFIQIDMLWLKMVKANFTAITVEELDRLMTEEHAEAVAD